MASSSFVETCLSIDAGIKVVDLAKSGWERRIFSALDPPFVPGSGHANQYRGEATFRSVLDVARNRLGARRAVIEPYVSTDWNEEYSALYARTFIDIPRSAARIHFFRKGKNRQLSMEDLYSLDEDLTNAYVGYTVIRPLAAFRVGDTVLASPWSAAPNFESGTPPMDLVHCCHDFRASLIGNTLKVKGMPFIQQDTTVGVCAEADLWMVARYLNAFGETRRFRPAEITKLATRMLNVGQPREGLIDLQILDALKQMGLNPIRYVPQDAREGREFVHSCVESAMPVIVGIPQHVVVVIGHDYISPAQFQGRIESMADLVAHFYTHNDATGPYNEEVLGEETLATSCEDDWQYFTINDQIIDSCIVAFPGRTNLVWPDVKQHAAIWLAMVSRYAAADIGVKTKDLWTDSQLKDLITRTYLQRSSVFKRHLLNPSGTERSAEIITKYRCIQMPKYVWVVELGRQADLGKDSACERKISGELVFDATANRHIADHSLLAFHLDGMLYVNGRGQTASEIVVCPDEEPYTPLLRHH